MNDTIKQARLQNKMKNPVVALVLGFVIPGAGQMYAGSVMWGVINLLLIIVCAITVIASPVAFILYLVSLFFGYKGCVKYNEKLLDAEEAKEATA
ncbi:TM2 domain containing protein [Vibrio ponticus]|uniref:hypothetical protein n=1 Tax=Vibrio rhodolitus TaxID=2231649 RepID=UPI0005019A44|nr:hypothetical protein [Vibrio rhodolitus]GAK83089.1 TM2 domain containing protein [Vibrio ponticus]